MRTSPAHPQRSSLMRRVFVALMGSVLVSTCAAALAVHAWGPRSTEYGRIRAFAAEQFEQRWDEPQARSALVESIERHFPVRVTVRDAQGGVVDTSSDPSARLCAGSLDTLTISRDGTVQGTVLLCIRDHRIPRSLVLGLGSFVVLLWISSGFVASRLLRPLKELVRVVRDIGDGKLSARMELDRHCRGHCRKEAGEVAEVAHAVNQMAEKIERQIAGQKELLATVSHEVRSPLARLRMLVELEREAQSDAQRLDAQRLDAQRLDAMDAELTEMDALTGQLLAQSRLDFETLERSVVPARELAQTALERANLELGLLVDASKGARVSVDAGLFGRALLNLIENAKGHGGGLVSLRVEEDRGTVSFVVIDHGPGFGEQALRRAFEPFAGTGRGKGLGLGLSLVKRIADAHRGTVEIRSESGEGSTVFLRLALAAD